ncbi:phosphotransferase family protein [Solirubrobacter deserti]|uniref:hypothetical protein n=1 Tax=Solirubrobacter deserti TaxID=2282478 RepID=UPI00389A6CDF
MWVGDEYVVRLSNGQFRDAYRHEATVVNLLAGSEVPHARQLAHGDGPDGSWSVTERLPGRTLYEAGRRRTRTRVKPSSRASALRCASYTASLSRPTCCRPGWPTRSPASRGRRSTHR